MKRYLWLALLLLPSFAKAQVPVQITPVPYSQFLDNLGAPLVGGLLYTYQAGTNIQQATYRDSTGTAMNTDPIVLDSSGRASIWLIGASYKFILKNSSGSTLWTQDGVSPGVFAAGDNIFTGDNTFSGTTTFSGSIVVTAGGALSGTFSGNPNFSGNPTFSSAISFPAGITGPLTVTGDLTVTGNVTCGAGCVSNIAAGFQPLPTASILSGACATTVTVAAAGVITSDVVTASFNSNPTGTTGYMPSTNGMLTIITFPTADAVNFSVCNNTLADITPGAVTINWKVVR